MFSRMVRAYHIGGDDVIPPSVPCYSRAIMLLEAEERWRDALRMAEMAIEVGIPNDWYQKRVVKLKKKISQT